MFRSILSFSIHHRYLIALLTAAIAAIGLYSLGNLPIDAVPDITNNQVQINTVAPALSVNEVEKQVTFPVETALAGIPGLQSTRSLSRNGFSQVTAVFADKVDIYFARQQVNERLNEAKESLPEGVEPVMGAISTGLGEIYMWTVEYSAEAEKKVHDGEAGWQSDGSYLTPEGQRLSSDLEKASYLRTVQDWIIRPQIKGVEGVAGVDAIGGYVQQYHVQPNPEKLVALGLSFADIIEAIEKNNHSIGAGYIEQGGESYVVRADGRITEPKELGDIVVATRRGVPIYLRDLADIGVGRELRTGSASENGEEVVVGTALMLIGANSRTVADAVDTKLKEVGKSLPPGIHAKTVLNRTKLVDATIATVQENLTIGALLVIAVLFWMLGNIRAAIITGLVIPVSMLMTAIGMVKGGISGNLMSLGALDFGLIVDGSIIITENCLKRLADKQHREQRLLTLPERLHEVMAASQEMIRPTVFGQLIIILVYIPMLTFTGVEGKMFSPMAMTVIIALVSALILSLTFVPAMIALFVKDRISEKESRVIANTRVRYESWLDKAIAQPFKVMAIALTGFALAVLIFMFMGREFIPTLDEKDIAMQAIRIPSTGITTSQEMQFAVEREVSKFKEVAFVFSKTGTAEMAADPMPPSISDTFIIMKPVKEWPDSGISKAKLIEKLEKAVAKVPGNNYEFTQPIQMRFNELISGVRSDVAVKLYGDDFEKLNTTAAQIAGVLQKIDGATEVKVEQTEGLPLLEVKLRKETIARYGLNVSDVLDVLAVAVGGREAGLIFEGDRRFAIVVRLPDELRQDIRVLESLPILLPTDEEGHDRAEYVPLKEVASLEMTEGPNQISRENGKRRIVIQSNVRDRDIGSFVADARSAIASSVKVPAGYWMEWGGQFENLEAASKRLMLVVPACFFMIFLLLFTALNSVKQALLVFSGIPLAVIGGVFTLFLFGMPFSVSAAVGFIALSGISVLNGLVMITSINQHVQAGQQPEQAIREGALSKLRPMLMAAIVPSLGYVPMALSTGAGAEVQRPLAMVVIGGLLVATALTMFVLPALYHHFKLWREVGG